MFSHGETVQIHRRVPPGALDEYGDPVTGYLPPEDIEGVALDEGGTGESTPTQGSAVTVTTRLVLIFDGPDAPVVAPSDQFTVRGARYAVDGEVIRPVNPWTAWAPGQTVTIKRVASHAT